MYEAKLEFLGGRGVQDKNLLREEYRYFLELHYLTPHASKDFLKIYNK